MYRVKRKAGASEAGASEAGASEAGPSKAGASEAGPSEAGPSEDDILVSGSHLVYDPSIKQFVHVKDLPSSELSEVDCDVLSCLITSDHTIPIGEWIFHDWEDSNGSAPKKIGGK
jgi:hypothetical protein